MICSLYLLLTAGFLIQLVHSHTTRLCVKVDENQNVLVGGLVDHASLHGSPDENYGGALLGNNNSYAFDGSEDYASNEYPSFCGQDGVECKCEICDRNSPDYWQTVTISNLA